MDTKMKYVIIPPYNSVLIFDTIIEHSEFKNLKPTSAGFCYVRDKMVDCFGKSISLGIGSGEKDSYYATKSLFGFEQALKTNNDGE